MDRCFPSPTPTQRSQPSASLLQAGETNKKMLGRPYSAVTQILLKAHALFPLTWDTMESREYYRLPIQRPPIRSYSRGCKLSLGV